MNQREPEWVFDGHGRLVDLSGEFTVQTFGPPEPIHWIAVDDLPSVLGRPVAHATSHGSRYDLRAASEVYEHAGGYYVNVVTEQQWWAWLAVPDDQRPEHCPRASAVRSVHIWAEVRDPGRRVDPNG